MLHYDDSPDVWAVFFGSFAGSAKEKSRFPPSFAGSTKDFRG